MLSYISSVFVCVCVFRCWLWEILPTPTVWLQPSLLPPSPKRTSPASPVWTTTELALRCAPLDSLLYFISIHTCTFRQLDSQTCCCHFCLSRSWNLNLLFFPFMLRSCRWRCAVAFLPPMWRMWSSGATTRPPSTQMCTIVWSTSLVASSPALMQSKMMPGSKESSSL